DAWYGGGCDKTRPVQPSLRATRSATSSGSSKIAAAVSPAASHPAHSGPRARIAIADVGHSSDTKTSRAAPRAVRSAKPTTAGSTPATDNIGARRLCIGRLLGAAPGWGCCHATPGREPIWFAVSYDFVSVSRG